VDYAAKEVKCSMSFASSLDLFMMAK